MNFFSFTTMNGTASNHLYTVCTQNRNIDFFSFSEAITTGSKDFFDLLVNCCLRLDTRARVIWPFEYTLSENPLTPDYYDSAERASTKAERVKYFSIFIQLWVLFFFVSD